MRSRRACTQVAAAILVSIASLVGVGGSAHAGADDPPPTVPDRTPPADVPPEVASAVARRPTEVVVAIDPAQGIHDLRTTSARSGSAAGEAAEARAYAAAKRQAVARAGGGAATTRDFEHLPVQIVRVESSEALARLASDPNVTSVGLPRTFVPVADSDLTLIQQPAAIADGLTGAGVRVAVLDSGVNATQGAFGSCGTIPTSAQIDLSTSCRITRRSVLSGNSSGDQDTVDHHGTNVAAIVAKVAPQVRIDTYQVFKVVQGDLRAAEGDVLAALDAVASDGAARKVKAVNLSVAVSEEPFAHNTSECGGSSFASVFSTLRSNGIVPVTATGNAAYSSFVFHDGVSEPACAPGAVRVGAVYSDHFASGSTPDCIDSGPDPDDIACFSQTGPGGLISVYAPGVAVAAGGETLSGTSQAAPHVSGAIAALATVVPDASAASLAAAVAASPTSIVDTRVSPSRSTPRLDLAAASASIGYLQVDAPSAVSKGHAFNVTVRAVRGDGTADPSVSGSLTVTSTDGSASLPGSASLSGGTATFSVTLRTGGTQRITVSAAGRSGRSGSITVQTTPADVVRISGDDRIATAIQASKAQFTSADSAGAVVLASSEAFPDGLAGTPLAAALQAPVLLTPQASLPGAVLAEIQRVLPAGGKVFVLGGPVAVSDAVVSSLTSGGLSAERLAGADRYATAAAIADRVGSPTAVLLATGQNFPDALSAGVAGAHVHAVVLFTQGTTQAPATQAWLAAHQDLPVFIVGGTADIGLAGATKLVGADRYETSVKVADRFFPSPTVAGVASGTVFPDALSGGAHLGPLGGPMLLTQPGTLPATVRAWLEAHADAVTRVYVYGGTVAIADAVPQQIQTATG
jgi:putative cell wall-binding protein